MEVQAVTGIPMPVATMVRMAVPTDWAVRVDGTVHIILRLMVVLALLGASILLRIRAVVVVAPAMPVLAELLDLGAPEAVVLEEVFRQLLQVLLEQPIPVVVEVVDTTRGLVRLVALVSLVLVLSIRAGC